MNFKDFEIATNTDTVVINNYAVPFTVLRYLPIEEKNGLIKLAIQNSEEDGVINPLKLDMFFGLYLVYAYTNIEFTEEEKSDEASLYNTLCSNGIITNVIKAIDVRNNIYPDTTEYGYLVGMLNETVYNTTKNKNNIASIFNNFITKMPINAEKAMEIIKQFNPEDFQEVLNFAQAANGGRTIN